MKLDIRDRESVYSLAEKLKQVSLYFEKKADSEFTKENVLEGKFSLALRHDCLSVAHSLESATCALLNIGNDIEG